MAPIDLGTFVLDNDALRSWQNELRLLKGSMDLAVERAGRPPTVVAGTVNQGNPYTQSIMSGVVPYMVTLQRRQVVNDVIERIPAGPRAGARRSRAGHPGPVATVRRHCADTARPRQGRH
jgi:hypothetical protein